MIILLFVENRCSFLSSDDKGALLNPIRKDRRDSNVSFNKSHHEHENSTINNEIEYYFTKINELIKRSTQNFAKVSEKSIQNIIISKNKRKTPLSTDNPKKVRLEN